MTGKSKGRIGKNYLYYFCNFSIKLTLFQNGELKDSSHSRVAVSTAGESVKGCLHLILTCLPFSPESQKQIQGCYGSSPGLPSVLCIYTALSLWFARLLEILPILKFLHKCNLHRIVNDFPLCDSTCIWPLFFA